MEYMPSELSFKARRCCFDKVAFNSSNEGLGIDMYTVQKTQIHLIPLAIALVAPDANINIVKPNPQTRSIWLTPADRGPRPKELCGLTAPMLKSTEPCTLENRWHHIGQHMRHIWTLGKKRRHRLLHLNAMGVAAFRKISLNALRFLLICVYIYIFIYIYI